MGVMFFKVAAGLCLYFITSSLWGIIERKLLPKPVLKTDDLPQAGDLKVDSTTPVKKKVSRAEEKASLKRETELAERKRRNAERAKRLKQRGV